MFLIRVSPDIPKLIWTVSVQYTEKYGIICQNDSNVHIFRKKVYTYCDTNKKYELVPFVYFSQKKKKITSLEIIFVQNK